MIPAEKLNGDILLKMISAEMLHGDTIFKMTYFVDWKDIPVGVP